MFSYLLKISKILFLILKFFRLLIVLKLILKILNYKNNFMLFKKKKVSIYLIIFYFVLFFYIVIECLN